MAKPVRRSIAAPENAAQPPGMAGGVVDQVAECVDGQFDDLGTIVTIDGDDDLTVRSFGEDAGTITIAKAADGSISVEVDGSGSVADGSDAEEQFLLPDDGACEHLLPEGADG